MAKVLSMLHALRVRQLEWELEHLCILLNEPDVFGLRSIEIAQGRYAVALRELVASTLERSDWT